MLLHCNMNDKYFATLSFLIFFNWLLISIPEQIVFLKSQNFAVIF